MRKGCGMKLVECFSTLVVSGNGQKCNDLLSVLHDELYKIDPKTKKYNIVLWKYENNKHIAEAIAQNIEYLFDDVDERYLNEF